MRPESHRRALLAAARIAAGAALLAGCHDPAPPEATAAFQGPVRASALDLPTCAAMVEAADFEKAVTDEVKGCCQKLAEEADGKGEIQFAHRGECCPQLDWQGTMACTPWGPPTPPAMIA